MPKSGKARLRRLPRSDPRTYLATSPGPVDVSSFARLLKWAVLLALILAAGVLAIGLPANQMLNAADIRTWRDAVQNQEMVFRNPNRVHVDYEQSLRESAQQAGLAIAAEGDFIERCEVTPTTQGLGLPKRNGYRAVQVDAAVNVDQTLLRCYTTRTSVHLHHDIYVPNEYELPAHSGARVIWQKATEGCFEFGKAGGSVTFGGATLLVPEGSLPERTRVIMQCGGVGDVEDPRELLWMKLRTDPPAKFARPAVLSAPYRKVPLASVISEARLLVKSAAFRLDPAEVAGGYGKDAVVFASPEAVLLQLGGRPGSMWFRHTSNAGRARKWMPTEVRSVRLSPDDATASRLEARAAEPGICVALSGAFAGIRDAGLTIRDTSGVVLGLATADPVPSTGTAQAATQATNPYLFVPVRLRLPSRTNAHNAYTSPAWLRAATKKDTGIEIGSTDGMASFASLNVWCRVPMMFDFGAVALSNTLILPNDRSDTVSISDSLAKMAARSAGAASDFLPNTPNLSAVITWPIREDGTYMAGW